MAYADYEYYTDSFLGDLITSETDFDKYALRASDYIDRITMNRAADYVADNADDVTVKKACCAAAEQFMMIARARASAAAEDGEIASESVGSHSVSYRSGLETAATLETDLRKIVSSYLSMTGLLYRGVSHVHAAHSYADYG